MTFEECWNCGKRLFRRGYAGGCMACHAPEEPWCCTYVSSSGKRCLKRKDYGDTCANHKDRKARKRRNASKDLFALVDWFNAGGAHAFDEFANGHKRQHLNPQVTALDTRTTTV